MSLRHPSSQQLALYAGRDLNWFDLLRVRLHLGRCYECRSRVDYHEAAIEGVQAGALDLPEGVDWPRLAAEMKANIHLGLEMSEIAGRVPRRRFDPSGESLGWRVALVGASLAVVIGSGWYLHRARDPYFLAQRPMAQATSEGIEFKAKSSALTLLAPASERVTTAEIGEGLQTRYVDQDSGQVTIQHVFTE